MADASPAAASGVPTPHATALLRCAAQKNRRKMFRRTPKRVFRSKLLTSVRRDPQDSWRVCPWGDHCPGRSPRLDAPAVVPPANSPPHFSGVTYPCHRRVYLYVFVVSAFAAAAEEIRPEARLGRCASHPCCCGRFDARMVSGTAGVVFGPVSSEYGVEAVARVQQSDEDVAQYHDHFGRRLPDLYRSWEPRRRLNVQCASYYSPA